MRQKRPWLALVVILVALNVALRILWLTTIPGMNGDEASGGVFIREWLSGQGQIGWVTQTHRFVPIFIGLAAFFYRLGPPSYLQLRLLPCVVGFLTVLAVWYAARAVFNRRWVRLGVVLTSACLPIQLAYSRTAWDPATTSLCALLFIVLILNGHYAWSLLAAALGFLIHPTVVFFAPYGLLCFLAEVLPRFVKSRYKRALVIAGLMAAAAPIGVLFYQSYVGPGGTGPQLHAYGWLSLKDYLLLMGGVISGSVPFESFVTKPSGLAAQLFSAANAFIIIGLCGCSLSVMLRSHLPWRRRLFPLGVLMAMAMMYILNPLQDAGHDRYTLGLVLPIVFVYAMAADSARHFVAAQQRMAFLTPALLLTGYCIFYVGAALATGGVQYCTYQSGPVDPKLAAKEWIVADSAKRHSFNHPIRIVADSWWVFWPIRYLTMDDHRIQVRHFAESDPNMPAKAKISSVHELELILADDGYAVGFSNGVLAKITSKLHYTRICARETFLDYAGRPSVTVQRLCSKR